MMNRNYWLPFGIVTGGGVGVLVGIFAGNVALGTARGAGIGVVVGSTIEYAQHRR